jgi:hypothetical protein
MNSIICEPYWQMCLYMYVMVHQREALAVTIQLTDTVYFGSLYRDSNRQPLDQRSLGHCELSGSYFSVLIGEEEH